MKTASLLEVWATAMTLVLGVTGCAGDASHRRSGQFGDDRTIATRVDAALLADELIRVAAYKGVIKTIKTSGLIESPDLACHAVLAAEEPGAAKSAKDSLPIPQL